MSAKIAQTLLLSSGYSVGPDGATGAWNASTLAALRLALGDAAAFKALRGTSQPRMVEPLWLSKARTHLGLTEVVGRTHNPVIMNWIDQLGAQVLGIKPNDDETPWCGTFMAWVMKEAGINAPSIAIRAAQWGRVGKWGRELVGPRLGCVLVFTRQGGGHVGLYMGEDETHYHVLGGNQLNSVSVMRLEKSRLAPGGMRWPKDVELPPMAVVRLTKAGAPVSGNEA